MSLPIICVSRKDRERISVQPCPTCKKRRRFYGWFQEWYGWHETCTACGEQWQDGEMCERPFRPKWRQDNAAEARRDVARIISKGRR